MDVLMGIGVWVMVLIGVAVVGIAGMLFLMYAVASGLSFKRQTEKEAWSYFNEMKSRRWDDLTPEQQDKLVMAYHIIELDCGIVPPSDDEIRESLKSQLPMTGIGIL